MPYISQFRRKSPASSLQEQATNLADSCVHDGELNYAISRMAHVYLRGNVSYTNINAVIGVLECVKLELYRMVAAPYEDVKRNENGPVLLEGDDDSQD